MKAIAWASCYLDPGDPVYDALSALGDRLCAMGMKLVLFGVPGDYAKYSGFEHVSTPHTLVEQGRLFGDFFAGEGLPVGAATVRELRALDRLFDPNTPDSEAELLILRTVAFWERAFDLMQPSIILGWGTTVPLARLMIRLGQRRQIPAYVMERGLLENTLTVSLSGQIALSSVTTTPSLIRPQPLDAQRLALWNQIENYYRNLVYQRYPASNQPPNPDIENFLQSDPKPRILFLASGYSLSDPDLGDRVDLWVTTSSEAAHRTADALKIVAPGCSFWSKSHPTIPFSLSPDDTGTVTIRNMPNVNVRRLVEATDIIVTMTSMTQALGLIYDRPFLSLGNGFFMGRDIGYEVISQDQLEPMLAAALARNGWNERLVRGRELLTSMAEFDLFGLTDEVPTKLKIDDLALLVGRFARYVKADMAPANVRYATFVTFKLEAEANRGAEGNRMKVLQEESDILRAQVSILQAEKNALIMELRNAILKQGRLVFDPAELCGGSHDSSST